MKAIRRHALLSILAGRLFSIHNNNDNNNNTSNPIYIALCAEFHRHWAESQLSGIKMAIKMKCL